MRLGVLDVGSNTVHLQIMDAHHGSAPTAIQSFKEEIKLAEYLDIDGAISRDGINALISTLKKIKRESSTIQLDESLSFATSAIREATNSDSVLDEVHSKTGFELQVLSGDDEARFTFLAVRRWVGWSAGDVIMLDIGGGSLEIAQGNGENPEFSHSLLLGVGRLTRQFLQGDPFTDKSLRKLEEHIATQLQLLDGKIKISPNRTSIATSKTFRTLRRIQKDFIPELGDELTSEGLRLMVPKLKLMTSEKRRALPGVSTSRADQIVAGALVAQASMDYFKLPKIKQCPWALREGIVLQRLDWLRA